MSWSRRQVLRTLGGATAAAFMGWQRAHADAPRPPAQAGPFGPLQADPRGILDLPAGFSYRVIARSGGAMSDGLLVPGMPDGMAAFGAPDGRIRLVCNHELDPKRAAAYGSPFGPARARFGSIARDRVYDPGGSEPSAGGTTTLIYDPRAGRVERQWLSLAGTERNCAGGATPWNSWLSCEESVAGVDTVHARDHGYVFEVAAGADALVEPLPLKAMGRFNHEAVVVDPRSGALYLTEDRPEGLIYRLLPVEPGRLAAGGRLQALALIDWNRADTRNWSNSATRFEPAREYRVQWIDLSGVDAPGDDLRQRGHAQGAAVFARGEGMWWGDREMFFTCTSGGALQAGQVFRYRPGADEGTAREREAPGTLSLFVESRDQGRLAHCDNLTVAPWGDLVLCEDTDARCGLVGVTADGGLYQLANNPYNESELAGACFAPDGRTLFLNIQKAGLSLAINGPFPAAHPAARAPV